MAAAIHGATQVVYRLDVHPKKKRPVEIYESAFLQSKLIRIQTTPRCFKSLLLPKQVQPETRSEIGRTGSETYIPPAKKMDRNIIGALVECKTIQGENSQHEDTSEGLCPAPTKIALETAPPTIGPTIGPPTTANAYPTIAVPRCVGSQMSPSTPPVFVTGADPKRPAKNRVMMMV
ncbi:hypothetical protein HO133_006467 [Letharia lupina]|uniref:Uncharacterized protein n=1 Tax=Letharia lupina TaxID=560253 RepID=A0A8H6C6U1_9LECA|nr:uncharacterized protein HO133_006467 [Letharia lupina]KAF6218055.1 hypothetical protein HO133_006467 [Letharia lupina]